VTSLHMGGCFSCLGLCVIWGDLGGWPRIRNADARTDADTENDFNDRPGFCVSLIVLSLSRHFDVHFSDSVLSTRIRGEHVCFIVCIETLFFPLVLAATGNSGRGHLMTCIWDKAAVDMLSHALLLSGKEKQNMLLVKGLFCEFLRTSSRSALYRYSARLGTTLSALWVEFPWFFGVEVIV
jgi:hypothetical protein